MERGLIDCVISTGANLYHDLHYALNFTLHRGSPFVNDVELYDEGSSASTTSLFPADVLLQTDAVYPRVSRPLRDGWTGVERGIPLRTRPRFDGTAAGVRGALGGRRCRGCRSADLHVVAG
jgi:hypothetical protein